MTFPAPTIPYPLSSDLSDDSEVPYLKGKSSFGNKVCPPTPSSPMFPLLAVDDGTLEYQQQSARRAAEGLRRQTKSKTTLSNNIEGFSSSEEGNEAGPGLEIDSESEDLEMSDYANAGEEDTWQDGDEQGRVKTRNRRGLSLQGGNGPSLGDRLIMTDGDRPVVSKEEKRIADIKVIRSLAINVILIGLWWVRISELECSYWIANVLSVRFQVSILAPNIHCKIAFSTFALLLSGSF